MGKKRKAYNQASVTKKDDVAASRTKYHINETFDDSDDEFLAGRDKVLLEEGPEAKRRRKLQEQEAAFEPSDEEILGYEDVSDNSEDELDEEDGLEENDYDEDEDEFDTRKSSRKSRQQRDASVSDDEGDDGIGAWGSSRKDYYNADIIETEADALEEEKEAKKIQLKHLKAMKEADFGFDETDWLEAGQEDKSKKGEDGVVTEVLPQLEITDDIGPEERLKILKSRYPEFEFLAKDFVDLQSTWAELRLDAEEAEKAINDHEEAAPDVVIKFRALSAYLGTISMYFALLTSPSQNGEEKTLAMPPTELRDHPLMGSLVECRKLWESVKDLRIHVSGMAKSDGSMSEMDVEEPIPVVQPAKKSEKTKQPKVKKVTKEQRSVEAARAEVEALRAEKLRQTEAELADLSNLVKGRSKKTKAQSTKVPRKNKEEDSDFGDEDALTAQEAEEKAKKKRSLRFYTSQIAQKANKRDAAGRDAGGDLDLPYRERFKDRQARLNAEAERRGRKQAGESELLGNESDDDDHRLAGEIRGDAAGTDKGEYYDMVAARNKQKKTEKQARAGAFAEAAREGSRVEVQEEVGPDGKRAITYQIEKNKGLAPKRNKDVRNPRVKKRKKFEQKKKRLGSIRQVYKGGEGRGGYAGELTGIKKNLVKSVKL